MCFIQNRCGLAVFKDNTEILITCLPHIKPTFKKQHGRGKKTTLELDLDESWFYNIWLWNIWQVSQSLGGFPCGSAGKESTCNSGDLSLTPGLGRFLEKGKATHSSILAWRIPWTIQWQRDGHDWVTSTFIFHMSLGNRGRSTNGRLVV